MLKFQLETKAHQRFGSATTNFEATLPDHQFRLAQQLVKQPYVLDFIRLRSDADERDLLKALTAHLTEFLLELGKGFAYMGRQYPLVVGGRDYYLDLLFYNTRLHCYVVIELKMDEFKPEHVGKMQFYLAAADEQLKSGEDAPSLGLILCKTKNGVIVEYALRDSIKPIGVAEYTVLPAALSEGLPTREELCKEFALVEHTEMAQRANRKQKKARC